MLAYSGKLFKFQLRAYEKGKSSFVNFKFQVCSVMIQEQRQFLIRNEYPHENNYC